MKKAEMAEKEVEYYSQMDVDTKGEADSEIQPASKPAKGRGPRKPPASRRGDRK